MAAGAVSWSLFDDHCFCEANGVCMRQLFVDDICYEVPIGHHECITPPSPHYQEEDRRSSIISIPSNSGSSTMVNEKPRPTHPSSGLMISHSIAMKEATTALEKFNAVESQMEEYNLGIVNTVEPDGAGFVPSLAVRDHAYYQIALKAAVAGHGRLRGAYWRVVQMNERSGLVRNDQRKNLMVARPVGENDRKLRQMKKNLEGRVQALHEDDVPNDEGKIDESAPNVVREWSLGKVVMKFWRLLMCLCGLPKSMKLVDPEQGYGEA